MLAAGEIIHTRILVLGSMPSTACRCCMYLSSTGHPMELTGTYRLDVPWVHSRDKMSLRYIKYPRLITTWYPWQHLNIAMFTPVITHFSQCQRYTSSCLMFTFSKLFRIPIVSTVDALKTTVASDSYTSLTRLFLILNI